MLYSRVPGKDLIEWCILSLLNKPARGWLLAPLWWSSHCRYSCHFSRTISSSQPGPSLRWIPQRMWGWGAGHPSSWLDTVTWGVIMLLLKQIKWSKQWLRHKNWSLCHNIDVTIHCTSDTWQTMICVTVLQFISPMPELNLDSCSVVSVVTGPASLSPRPVPWGWPVSACCGSEQLGQVGMNFGGDI